MTLIQGCRSKVKVTAYNGLNIVRAMFSLKAWSGIIFHKIITLDPRKCHDLDPRSLVKGQGQYIQSSF
jgi:hypothetical protein